MKVWRIQPARFGLLIMAALWMLVALPLSVAAAPYAAYVVDARTGEVLHARNADTRLHPASLTKMMTLYIAFEAIEKGEISLDTMVTISKHAASEPPSKLGLKSGQKIAMRYLVRAAAVKSANDAATAIGEALSGSEARFARRMTRTAKALGMSRTTFKNAHGLTEKGHMSTAHDMTILGRHVLYDYPQYYNLFSRRTTYAGIREVANTNRRLLGSYKGADGIKTGYTRAAGSNLVASAERGNKRIIATVFGGKSSASRNAKVAELLDLGFRRAPNRAPVRKPNAPAYVADNSPVSVETSLRPKARAKVVEAPLLLAKAPKAETSVLPADINVALAAAQEEVIPRRKHPNSRSRLNSPRRTAQKSGPSACSTENRSCHPHIYIRWPPLGRQRWTLYQPLQGRTSSVENGPCRNGRRWMGHCATLYVAAVGLMRTSWG